MARCTASASAVIGPREGVIDRRGLAFRQRALHNHVDHAAVLGVHADQRAVLRRARQRLENRGVVHHQDARIRHEQFETRDALGHHRIHIFHAGVGQIGDDHVQPVVDHRAIFRLLPPGIERVAHLRAAAPGWRNRPAWWCRRKPPRACRSRNRRWRWCRRTACRDAYARRCRRAAAACPVASITLSAAVAGSPGAISDYLFAGDQEVRFLRTVGVDDFAVADQSRGHESEDSMFASKASRISRPLLTDSG